MIQQRFLVGSIVRVLPAYRQPMGSEPARFVADGTEGIYVVVGESRGDVLVCHTEAWDRAVLSDLARSGELSASDYDYAVHPDRLTTDLARTERAL